MGLRQRLAIELARPTCHLAYMDCDVLFDWLQVDAFEAAFGSRSLGVRSMVSLTIEKICSIPPSRSYKLEDWACGLTP